MKCKKHVTDHSSTIGVCASCLRERLFVLIAAQSQAQAQAQAQQALEDRRKSDTNPPPLVFPRSVSPYISRRKCDATSAAWRDTQQHYHQCHQSIPDQRFFSTPQVGPTGVLVAAGSHCKKKNGIRFSFFTNLFRSKSDKFVSDVPGSGQIPNYRDSCTDSSSSPSWFSTMLPGRRKKQTRTFSVDESTIGDGHRRVCRNPDKGISPARYSNVDDEHCNYGSSGYSSESSQPWKKTPRRTPASVAPGRRGGGSKSAHSRNISGMGFCLSPLVRASPSRQWNQKGIPPEMVVASEIRVLPTKSHFPNATSFSKNRSRKLADFGRSDLNR